MFFKWRNDNTQTQSNGTNGSVSHVIASKPAIDLAVPIKTETATFALG